MSSTVLISTIWALSSCATGWRVMWGLNLGTGTKDEAAEEAMAVDQALVRNLTRLKSATKSTCCQVFEGLWRLPPRLCRLQSRDSQPAAHAMFSGPDSAGNLEFIKNFVADEAADVKLVTQHYYRSCARKPEATMDTAGARQGIRYPARCSARTVTDAVG